MLRAGSVPAEDALERDDVAFGRAGDSDRAVGGQVRPRHDVHRHGAVDRPGGEVDRHTAFDDEVVEGPESDFARGVEDAVVEVAGPGGEPAG